MKAVNRLVVLSLYLLSFSSVVWGDGLLGSNYFGAGIGFGKFGEDALDDIFGTITSVEGVGNINVHENVDLRFNAGYGTASGDYSGADVDVDLYGFSGMVVFFMPTESMITPYGGIGLTYSKAKATASLAGTSISADDDEVSFGAEIGVEAELSPEWLLQPFVDYSSFAGESEFGAGTGIGYWFNDALLGSFQISYQFDEGDIFGVIGVIVRSK